MNKTKRMGRATIFMDGSYSRLEKYRWQCCVCGTIYVLQSDARECNHGYKNSIGKEGENK